MPLDIQEVLDHAHCTHTALEVAKAEREKVAADAVALEQQLVPLRKAAVEAMIKHARFSADYAAEADRILHDPVLTMQLVTQLADTSHTTAPKPLGAGDRQKTAAAGSRNGLFEPGNMCGIRNGRPTPADEAYERHFRG